MTVSVSLFLFGGILLVSRVVDHGTSKWIARVELEIFMQVKASGRQIQGVKDSLDADSGAGRVRQGRGEELPLLHQGRCVKEFRKLFQDEPVLVENTTAAALPTHTASFVQAGADEDHRRRVRPCAGVKGSTRRRSRCARCST